MEKITVEYSRLKKIVKKLDKMDTKPDDEISFEFVVGSLFPHILANIKEEIRRQYTQGYAEGLKAKKDEVT